MDDLQRAVALAQEAVDLAPSNFANRASLLHNFATALRDWYVRSGDLDALERAVEAHAEAVSATREGSPMRALHLDGLAIALFDRHRRTHDRDDLDRCVDAEREALADMPDGAPLRSECLNNLGNALRYRATVTGSREDLADALDCLEEALAVMPSDASRAPMVLTNLALTRALLYESTRNPRQLDAAIEDSQRAALRAPGSALMWHWTQQALAESLRMRYERDRRCADLEHAVTAFRASCTDVASHAEHALTCAGRWGSWAAERHAFSEAAEAYGIAVHAARKVFEGQLVRRQTESWLQETQGVHARGAHAMAMAGDARAAVRTLEDGRAVLLSEALERDRADLHHLATLERGELADRYRKAADRLIDATRVGEPAGLAELSRS